MTLKSPSQSTTIQSVSPDDLKATSLVAQLVYGYQDPSDRKENTAENKEAKGVKSKDTHLYDYAAYQAMGYALFSKTQANDFFAQLSQAQTSNENREIILQNSILLLNALISANTSPEHLQAIKDGLPNFMDQLPWKTDNIQQIQQELMDSITNKEQLNNRRKPKEQQAQMGQDAKIIDFRAIAQGNVSKDEVSKLAEDYALDIRDVQLQLLREVTLSDFHNKGWEKLAQQGKYSTLSAIPQFNDKIKTTIENHLLRDTANRQELEKTYFFYLEVAEKAIANNDFMTASTIVGTLNSAAIYNLREKFDNAADAKVRVENLQKNFNPGFSYKAVRENHKNPPNAEKAVVPYMGVFTTDITFTEDGNPNGKMYKIEGKDVKKAAEFKVKLLGNVLKPVVDLQERALTESRRPHQTNALATLLDSRNEKSLTQDELYNLSVARFPRKPIEISKITTVNELLKAFKSGYLPADMTITKDDKVLNGKAAIAEIAELALNLVEADSNLSLEHKLKGSALGTLLNEIEKSAIDLKHSPENFEQRLQGARDKIKPTPEAIILLEELKKHENDAARTYFALDYNSRQQFTQELKALQESNPDPFVKSKIGEVLKDLQAIDNYQSLVNEVKNIRSLAALPISPDTNTLLQHLSDIDKLKSAIETKTKESGPEVIRNHAKSIKKDIMEPDDPIGIYSRNIYRTLGQNIDSVLDNLYEEYLDKIMDTYNHPDNKTANDKRITEINTTIDLLKKSPDTQKSTNAYSEKIEKEIKPLASGFSKLTAISQKLATFDTLEYRDKIKLGLEAYALSNSEIPTIRAVAQSLINDNDKLKEAIQAEQHSHIISVKNAAELLSDHDGPDGQVKSLQSQLFNYQVEALKSKKSRDPILESWLHSKVSGLISSQEALLDSPFPEIAQQAQDNLNIIKPMYDGFKEKMDTLGKRSGFFVRRTSSVTAKDKENKDLKKQLKSALSHIPTKSTASKGYSTPLTEPVYSKESIKSLLQQIKDAKYDSHYMQVAYLLDKQMSKMLTRDDQIANDSRDAALITIALITDYLSSKDIEHSYPNLKTIYNNHERSFLSEVKQMRISNSPDIALVLRLFEMENYEAGFKQLAKLDVNKIIKTDSPASDKALLQRWINIAKHETSNLAKSGFQNRLNQEVIAEYKKDPAYSSLMLNQADLSDFVHYSINPANGNMVPTKTKSGEVLRGIPAIKKTLSEYSLISENQIFRQTFFSKIDYLLALAQNHPVEEFRSKAQENLKAIYQLADASHEAVNEKQRAFHDFSEAYPNRKQALLTVLGQSDLGTDPRVEIPTAQPQNQAEASSEPAPQRAEEQGPSQPTQDEERWMRFDHEEGVERNAGLQIGSKKGAQSAEAKSTDNTLEVQRVKAFDKAKPMSSSAGQVQLNCPQTVLSEFQKIIENSNVKGASYQNPYTNQTERFPDSAAEFTAQHLQILARNESVNITGKMKTELYNNLLSDEQIARIRCLVKSTNVAGIIQVDKMGGFPPGVVPVKEFDSPQKAILVDQAGFQWQSSEMNTGAVFFYPDGDVPESYSDYQSQMYEAMLGHPRPKNASENTVNVNWQGKNGKLDLDLLENGIAVEFLQALDAASSQGELSLSADEKINFKFLKAGMGFFASGLEGNDNVKFEHARLQGILQALKSIEAMPKQERQSLLGKIGRIELPFSGLPSNASEQYTKVFTDLEASVKALGLEWGGIPREDVFAPRKGYVNASTNCADPHAMIGNEGSYGSVDAAISTNASVDHLNAAYNNQMQLRQTPTFNPLENKVENQQGEMYRIGPPCIKINSGGQPDSILQILHGYDFQYQPITHTNLRGICSFLALNIDPSDIVTKMIAHQPKVESPNTGLSPVQAAYSRNVALMAAYFIESQPDIFLSRLPKTDDNPEGKSLYQQIYPVLKGLSANSEEMQILSDNIRTGAALLKTLPSLPQNPEVANSKRIKRTTGIDLAKKALRHPDISSLKQSDVSKNGPKLRGKKDKQDLATFVAADLFHQQTGILADITADQIQSYKWGRDTNDPNAPITQLIEFSTNLTNHVRDQILLSDSLNEQKDILSHYIRVMGASIQKGDFNTAMAIESAISGSSISRLKLVEKLDKSTQKNYNVYRSDISADDMANRRKLKENIALKSIDSSVDYVIPPINFFGAENDKLGSNPKEIKVNNVDVASPQYHELFGKVNLPLLNCAHSARVYIQQHLDNAPEGKKAHPIKYHTDIADAVTKHKLTENESYARSLAILPRTKEGEKAPKHFQNKELKSSDEVLKQSIQAAAKHQIQQQAQQQAAVEQPTSPATISATETGQSPPTESIDEASTGAETVRDDHTDSTDMDLSSRRSSVSSVDGPIDDITQARANAKAVLENPHLMQQEVIDYIGQHLPEDEFNRFKQDYKERIKVTEAQDSIQPEPKSAIDQAIEKLGLLDSSGEYTSAGEVYHELYDTEASYVKQFSFLTNEAVQSAIIKFYQDPAHAKELDGSISLEQAQKLFSAYNQLAEKQSNFLSLLSDASPDPEKIRQGLQQLEQAYKRYIIQFNAGAQLPKAIDSLLSNTKLMQELGITDEVYNSLPNDEGLNKSLSALSIQPIQRFPRYVLLAKDLDKKTPKEHPYKSSFAEIHNTAKTVANNINRGVKIDSIVKDAKRYNHSDKAPTEFKLFIGSLIKEIDTNTFNFDDAFKHLQKLENLAGGYIIEPEHMEGIREIVDKYTINDKDPAGNQKLTKQQSQQFLNYIENKAFAKERAAKAEQLIFEIPITPKIPSKSDLQAIKNHMKPKEFEAFLYSLNGLHIDLADKVMEKGLNDPSQLGIDELEFIYHRHANNPEKIKEFEKKFAKQQKFHIGALVQKLQDNPKSLSHGESFLLDKFLTKQEKAQLAEPLQIATKRIKQREGVRFTDDTPQQTSGGKVSRIQREHYVEPDTPQLDIEALKADPNPEMVTIYIQTTILDQYEPTPEKKKESIHHSFSGGRLSKGEHSANDPRGMNYFTESDEAILDAEMLLDEQKSKTKMRKMTEKDIVVAQVTLPKAALIDMNGKFDSQVVNVDITKQIADDPSLFKIDAIYTLENLKLDESQIKELAETLGTSPRPITQLEWLQLQTYHQDNFEQAKSDIQAARRQLAVDVLKKAKSDPNYFTYEHELFLHDVYPNSKEKVNGFINQVHAHEAATRILRDPRSVDQQAIDFINENLQPRALEQFHQKFEDITQAMKMASNLIRQPHLETPSTLSELQRRLPQTEFDRFNQNFEQAKESLEQARQHAVDSINKPSSLTQETMDFIEQHLPQSELSEYKKRLREALDQSKVGQQMSSHGTPESPIHQNQSAPERPTVPPSSARDGLGQLLSKERDKRHGPAAQNAATTHVPQPTQRQPLQPVALGQARTTGLQTSRASQAEKLEIGQVDNLSIKQFEAAARNRMGDKGKVVSIQPYPQRKNPSDPTSSTRGVQITIQAGENRVKAYADNVTSPKGKQSTKLSLAKNTPQGDAKLAIKELCQIAIASAKPNSTITIPQKLDGEKRLLVAQALKEAIKAEPRFNETNAPTIKGAPTGSERRRVNLNKGNNG